MPIRPSTDSLLLAAACPIIKGQRVLDVGAGDGSVALLILERMPSASAVGFELQSSLSEVALQNAGLMGLSASYQHETLDILSQPKVELHNSFNCVVTNPPFFATERSRQALDNYRKESRSAPLDEIDQWLRAAFAYLKPKGFLTCVWPAARLLDLTKVVSDRASHLTIVPIRFGPEKSTERLLLVARKGHGKPSGVETHITAELAYYGQTRSTIHTGIFCQKRGLWNVLQGQGIHLPPYLLRFKGT